MERAGSDKTLGNWIDGAFHIIAHSYSNAPLLLRANVIHFIIGDAAAAAGKVMMARGAQSASARVQLLSGGR
jgi:hypothetical protein